jgi:hypothetical protein
VEIKYQSNSRHADWMRPVGAAMDEPCSAFSRSKTPRPRITRVSQGAQHTVLEELHSWLLEPAEIPDRLPNVIAYWMGKSGSYPQLSHMALEVFFDLPVSCEAERIFSRYVSSDHCPDIMRTPLQGQSG